MSYVPLNITHKTFLSQAFTASSMVIFLNETPLLAPCVRAEGRASRGTYSVNVLAHSLLKIILDCE